MSTSSGPTKLELETFRGADVFANELQLPAGCLKMASSVRRQTP